MSQLIYSFGVSVDGFIANRDGNFDWGVPSAEQFRFHLDQVRGLGVHLCGRNVYETMRVWETDPSLRGTEDEAAFADVWTALPKVVFSRTLDHVEGNARLAEGSLAEEVAAALASTELDVAVGGADLGRQAVEQDLVDELHIFRNPVLVGGGNAYFPAITEDRELELLETRTFLPRVAYERYRCVR